jgi:hypothetical protein
MNQSGDVAEQIVRISLEGTEYALKITGHASMATIKALQKLLAQQKKSAGAMRVANLLKSGEPTSIFTIRERDLKAFAKEAKRYGVLYTVIRTEKASPNSSVDIMVKRNDESKIDRIIKRFGFHIIDSNEVAAQIERERAEKDGAVDTEGIPVADPALAGKDAPDVPDATAAVTQDISDGFIDSPLSTEDPTTPLASQRSLSEASSTNASGYVKATDKGSTEPELEPAIPSVLKEIERMKTEREVARENKALAPKAPGQSRHTQPAPKVKPPKTKER